MSTYSQTPNFEWLEQRRAATAGGERDFEASRSYARRDQASALFTEIERVFRESPASTSCGRRNGGPSSAGPTCPRTRPTCSTRC